MSRSPSPHARSAACSVRWRSPEFLLYYAVLASSTAYIVYRTVLLSRAYDSGGEYAAQGKVMLSRGWIMGRKMDLSDAQWRTFRSNLKLATATFGAFLALSAVVKRLRRGLLVPFNLVFSAAYLSFLHGSAALFLLAALVASHAVSRLAAGRPLAGPAVVWAANCALLYYVRWYSGFQFHQVHPSLSWLDAYRGGMRWHVTFNMVVLRAISYGMDLHWARSAAPVGGGAAGAAKVGGGREGAAPGYRERVEAHQPLSCYSLPRFLAYALYPPLYVAGPTTTFNAFSSHVDIPQEEHSPSQVLLYAARLAGCLLGEEVLTHYMYVNGLAKTGVWKLHGGAGTAEVWLIGFFVLNFMWLKFLCIWRFFRLVALADGIESPENMRRCVNNTVDIAGFWQSWHASYNRWLVRYMYIPLGGATWRAANVWVIFTFVGVWHDAGDHLLGWAWLMAGFLLPEVGFKWAGRRWVERGGAKVRDTWQYRQVRAVGATVMILVLISANLVGFVIGLGGLKEFLSNVLSGRDLGFSAIMLSFFFSLSHVMFE